MSISKTGNKKLMKPGKDYAFPGDFVLEVPVKNKSLYNRLFKKK